MSRNMSKFTVWIQCEYAENYARKMGDMEVLPFKEDWEQISADDLMTFARSIANFGSADKIEELAEAYGISDLNGDEFVEALVGHIADEILESCCRTVFEW